MPARKIFIGVLITLCLGLQLLEASGQWDRTLGDTADETQIVTIVLCVGGAIIGAAAALARVRASRPTAFTLVERSASPDFGTPAVRLRQPLHAPPLSLRI